MTSGFGAQGGPGRCTQLWLSYSKCVDESEKDPASECRDLRADYFECLHHRVEMDRRSQVVRKLQALGGKIPEEQAAAAGHGSHGGGHGH